MSDHIEQLNLKWKSAKTSSLISIFCTAFVYKIYDLGIQFATEQGAPRGNNLEIICGISLALSAAFTLTSISKWITVDRELRKLKKIEKSEK